MTMNNLKYKRISILVAVSLMLYGVYSYLTMPKSEDPTIAKTAGILTIIYPGASISDIREFVLKPVEDELSDVASLQDLKSTIRNEVLISTIRIDEKLEDKKQIYQIWDEIRRGIKRAELKFPSGVRPFELSDDLLEKEAIVLAVQSEKPLLETRDEARKIRDEILTWDYVKKVNINADPGEQVSIEIQDDKIIPLGLNYFEIINQLRNNNKMIPTGSVTHNGQKVTINSSSRFSTVEEIRNFPLVLKSSDTVLLKEIANVTRTIIKPTREEMNFNGKQAIGLGIVLKDDIDLIEYDKYFTERFEALRADFPKVNITKISYFPKNVENRILDLGSSLISGIVLLAVVLMILMGFRVGLLVSVLIPMITAVSLGAFSYTGGVLQQISIAAFVMALGLLVDNIIVIADAIQAKINKGDDKRAAAETTIKEFALPLFAATGTTVASFIPMMISEGGAAQFTRSLATVTAITLSVSYLFSIFLTPIIASDVLKANKKAEWKILKPVSSFLANIISKYPKLILGGVSLLVLGSLALVPLLKFQFFPFADRDQLVIDIRMPEGTVFEVTKERAQSVTDYVMRSPLWEKKIQNIASYVGRSTPRFFYNLNLQPNSPHIAQMIIRLNDFTEAKFVKETLEKNLQAVVPDGIVLVRELEQGPPVEAAVEVKIFGENDNDLVATGKAIESFAQKIPAARHVRLKYGQGTPEIHYNLDDTLTSKFGINREIINTIILGRSRGIPVGEFRKDDDPVQIILKSPEGEKTKTDKLLNSYVLDTRTGKLLVKDFVSSSFSIGPSVQSFENGKKLMKVFIESASGKGYNDIHKDLDPFLKNLKLPKGISIKLDGQRAESLKSNKQLVNGAPISFIFLILFLLIQFNSYKKAILVFTSVPISFIGLAPSHLVNGFPFGFFSLLGALALIGIIVNNAILIIEFLDVQIAEGLSFQEAVYSTLEQRLRPIFLTTFTTVLGLLPLAYSDATLWPPFAWTICYGLVLGSILTILFVPALYRILIIDGVKFRVPFFAKKYAPALLVLISLIPFSSHGQTQKMGLDDVIKYSENSSINEIAISQSEISKSLSELQTRLAFMPKLGLEYRRDYLNEEQRLSTPFGQLPFKKQQTSTAGIKLIQPLLDVSEMIYKRKEASYLSKASELEKKRFKQLSQLQAALLYLNQQEIKVKINSLSIFKRNLYDRQVEINRFLRLGKVSEVDVLKIETAINEVSRSLDDLHAILPPLQRLLAKSIGLDGQIESNSVEETKAKAASLKNLGSDTSLKRFDELAMEEKIHALSSQASSIKSDYLPKVSLEAGVLYQDPTPLNSTSFNYGAIVLRWNIFEGGTRQSRLSVVNEQKRIVSTQLTELRRNKESQIEKFKLLTTSAIKDIPTKEKNFDRITKATKLERKQYNEGKSRFNDLLDAEDLLQKQQEKRDLVYIEAVSYYLNFLFESGLELEIKK